VNGNVSTTVQKVTIVDNESPAFAVADIEVNNDPGQCAGEVFLAAPKATDNCGVATLTRDFASDVFPVGETVVTWTATDVNGNVSTKAQRIVVVDNEPPVIICHDDILLSACEPIATWSLPEASDNCSALVAQAGGPPSGSVFQNGSTTTIMYKATDPAGNEATCAFTVSRAPALTASVGVNNSKLFFGLSDQSATIIARAQGGRAPYTISMTMDRPLNCNVVTSSGDEIWTGGAGTAGESNTVCPASGSGMIPLSSSFTDGVGEGGSYSVIVTLMQDAVITATITDADGCVAHSSINIHAEDVRCYAGNSGKAKISICHNTGSAKNPCKSICVDETSLADHLAHGDFVGICTSDCMDGSRNPWLRTITRDGTVINHGDEVSVGVYPSPMKSFVSITVSNPDNQPVRMKLMDMTGVSMLSRQPVLSSEGVYHVDTEQLSRGLYILRVQVGMATKTVKLIKE
jgi:hypothetical protein